MKSLVLGLMILTLLAIGAVASAHGPGMMGHGTMESEQTKKPQTQNTTAGAHIFDANCQVCHLNGGNLINPAVPLKGSAKLSDFKTFLSFIRNPKLSAGAQGTMPSFSDSQISDKQAEALYQFITSSESNLMGGGQGGGGDCPRDAQCRGNQQRYPMGSGMMGTGQQGWNYCPYCGQSLGTGGHRMMGPGMMSGQGIMGMMHGGSGIGPGMMRGGMWPGMMGTGYPGQNADCQKFLDETADLRKDFHNKKFEYMEIIRNPKATLEPATELQDELNKIHGEILSKAPQGCWTQ